MEKVGGDIARVYLGGCAKPAAGVFEATCDFYGEPMIERFGEGGRLISRRFPRAHGIGLDVTYDDFAPFACGERARRVTMRWGTSGNEMAIHLVACERLDKVDPAIFEIEPRLPEPPAPRGDRVTRGGSHITPRDGRITPGSDRVTPRGGRITPRGGRTASRGGRITPGGDLITPRGGSITPGGYRVTPRGCRVASRGGGVTLRCGFDTTRCDGNTTPGSASDPVNMRVTRVGITVAIAASRQNNALDAQGAASQTEETAMKKTCYPPKTFDDALDALVRLFQAKGWAFTGVDVERLATDVDAQRAERAEHDTLQSQYVSVHETFGVSQEARYERFLAALNAARAVFRNDKAVMAELERFKRHAGRKRKTSEEAA
jgi:hypothetical protein